MTNFGLFVIFKNRISRLWWRQRLQSLTSIK